MFITDHSKGEKVTQQVVFWCATWLTQAYMIDAMHMCKVHPDDPNYWMDFSTEPMCTPRDAELLFCMDTHIQERNYSG